MLSFKPKNKYGAKKSKGFDSKAECADYNDLYLLEKSGKIKYLNRQVKIPLQKKTGGIHYIADFVYFDCEAKEWIVFDTKGMVLDTFRIKKSWLLDRYTNFVFITHFRSKRKLDYSYPSQYAEEDLSKIFVEKFVI